MAGQFVVGFDVQGNILCGPTHAPVIDFPGRLLRGIAYDSGALWVLHGEASGTSDVVRIAKLNAVTGEVLFESGSLNWNGRGLTVGAGSLWVADALHDRIHRLDPTTLSVMGSFSTPGSEPNGLAYDGNALWLTDPFFQRTYQLSTSGAVIDSFTIPNAYRTGLEWDGIGLWSNTAPAEVSRSLRSGATDVTRILQEIPPGVHVYDVAIGGGKIYVSAGSSILIQDWP